MNLQGIIKIARNDQDVREVHTLNSIQYREVVLGFTCECWVGFTDLPLLRSIIAPINIMLQVLKS